MDWQLVASYFTVKSTKIFYSVAMIYIFGVHLERENPSYTQKEITSQTYQYLVILSSKNTRINISISQFDNYFFQCSQKMR